jgi:hypothetical protein
MNPQRIIFAVTALVWLLLSATGLYAQPPVKKLFVKTSGQPAAVVVYDTDEDQTVEIQAAINEAATEHLPLYLIDGTEYTISDTLIIPSRYGFEFYGSGGPGIDGTVHPDQRGCFTALVWDGPDDGRPMIECRAAHCRMGIHLKGKELDGDTTPENLIGMLVTRTTVPAGQIRFDWLRVDDMAVGVQMAAPGEGEINCDMLQVEWLMAYNVEEVVDFQTSFSVCHDFEFIITGGCPKIFSVHGGGDIVAHRVICLGATTILTIEDDIGVLVGNGNGSYRISNVKVDEGADSGVQLLSMEVDANIDVLFDGGLIPLTTDPMNLITAKGPCNVTVEHYRGILLESINADGTNNTTGRCNVFMDHCRTPGGDGNNWSGTCDDATIHWRDCTPAAGGAVIVDSAEVFN